jgi:hypothetical protein
LGWIYKTVSANTTNSTYFSFATSAPGNVVSAIEDNVNGSWSVVEGTVNERCHIEKEAIIGLYRMVLKELVSGIDSSLRITAIPLTPILTNITITNSTKWFISSNCQRLAVAPTIFTMNANRDGFTPTSATPVPFTAWDQEMSTAVISG